MAKDTFKRVGGFDGFHVRPTAQFTDEELIVELQLRHPGRSFAPVGSTVNLSDFSDDALRAECGKRGIVVGYGAGAKDWHAQILEAKTERDEWKRRAEATETDMMKLGWAPPLKSERWEALVRENAELQRRAEAAEAALGSGAAGCGRHAEDRAQQSCVGVVAEREYLRSRVTRGTATKPDTGPLNIMRGEDASKGIAHVAATKPETERWGPSDEDLLADDV